MVDPLQGVSDFPHDPERVGSIAATKLSASWAGRRTPRDKNVWFVEAMVTLHLEIILQAVRVG